MNADARMTRRLGQKEFRFLGTPVIYNALDTLLLPEVNPDIVFTDHPSPPMTNIERDNMAVATGDDWA